MARTTYCESCEHNIADSVVIFNDGSEFAVCPSCATALPDECDPIPFRPVAATVSL